MASAITIGTAISFASVSFAVPPSREEPIKPVPTVQNVDPKRAELGRQLFYDVRLSGSGSVSCASCHDTTRGGADGRSHSIGVRGEPTSLNAPTVLNAALNFTQFWNGRADSLEDQIDAVVQNPVEMGSRWPVVVSMVSRDAAYSRAFANAYRDGVTRANIQNAIATFERTLITPNSRFDAYLQGEADAITPYEKAGYAKFKKYGCVSCHQGVNVGGNMFQKFGVMEDYLEESDKPTEADLGRFLVTGSEDDRYVFKVPGLRNVALTAPYFHDGSAPTLDAAVDVMFRYQLGRVASKEDKSSIIAFLKTLTGDQRVLK
ncbi:MAG: cytochrome-c peroxidase [Hyphomonadaceae bacterium]